MGFKQKPRKLNTYRFQFGLNPVSVYNKSLKMTYKLNIKLGKSMINSTEQGLEAQENMYPLDYLK